MKKIALLPGGFKPPHAGHYNMAKWLAKNTDADVVVVKVGAKERDGITREMSLQLWNLYKESDSDPLSNKLLIQPSTSNSPVQDVYDFVEDTAPEGSTVYLGMGEKDTSDSRFKNIGKFAEPRNIQFQTVLVPPQAGGVSGTEMRGFIKNNQDTFFYNSLPDHMTDMDKEDAWAIVIPNPMNEDLYDPNDHVSDYMKSSEWKAGMPDGPKKDINPSYKYKRGGLYGKMYEEDINNTQDLEEVGDGSSKPYPFHQGSDRSRDEDIYGFTTTSGEVYEVLFDYAETEGTWYLAFDTLDGKGNKVVNKGEIYSVMSTISNITFDFIKRTNPKTILFSPAKNFNNDNRRANLFLAYIREKAPNWVVGKESGFASLTNPKYTPNKINELDDRMYNETVTDTDINLYPFKITDKTYDEEDNSLITTEYKFITPNNTYRVEFYSGEYNPEVKTFDLSFGVDKGELNTIDTFQMTGEGNARKIFKTILNITKDFINKEDVNKIVVDGTDEKRKRIYKTIFSSTPPEISDKIELKEAILNETVTDTDIICDNCGWTWAIVDGGDDLYICHTCGHDNTPNTMNEQKLFSKNWWKDIINEILLSEGGAAGHMAHPFDLPNVTSGRDLVNVFEQAADSLQTNPGAVKIDGVNSSIRLIDVGGTKQFAMDRGSKKELDIKGITKADLEDRFSPGHGMIKVGGEVLDMFNEALPTIQGDLKKLGALDDPSILFNMEYVAGKTNVQDYGSNFIAIHGLNKVKMEEVPGRMYRGKPLVKRYSQEFNYDKNALQSLLNNLSPIAKKRGFEVYGSVPTEMTTKPNFRSALSKRYTVETNEGAQVKPLGQWLEGMDNIPVSDFIFMNVGSGKKKVGAVSKQVYLAILKGGNVDELFEDQDDKQKAINGFATYLGTEKLGDEVLKVLNSPMGSVENHEGVVVRDEKIANIPFKITGKFILGGMVSDF